MTPSFGADTAPASPESPSVHVAGFPRELREDAGTMSWGAFTATYAPSGGPVRLGRWECTEPDRPATRWGPQPRAFRATLGVGDRVEIVTAAATGPLAALTAMLYDGGVAVETLTFHQLRCGAATVTFIRGSNGLRAEWAMGLSADPTQSALQAVVACANRLYG
ncbi:homocitrate synthase [Mycobacterium sp.]|uniref:homocitrate synthase n=1 Tax=Mycobacterium sp. TaxID=1785 RepID=UPI0031D1328F